MHPAAVEAFEQGELHGLDTVRTPRGLKADEALFAQLLRRHARAMRVAAREATRSMAGKRTPKSPGGWGRSAHAVRSSRSGDLESLTQVIHEARTDNSSS
ncbi:hypothetical protein [Paraburkholderia kururiensis]|uniref:hypothetical protein n=1 Tax=Paraburkholderia kururiensis TaxID=984307 RepID=UPI0039A680A1